MDKMDKVIRIGSQLEIPGDEVIVSLKIYKSMKMQLQAPSVHPKELCKMLHNLIYDLQYASLKQIDTTEVNQRAL